MLLQRNDFKDKIKIVTSFVVGESNVCGFGLFWFANAESFSDYIQKRLLVNIVTIFHLS